MKSILDRTFRYRASFDTDLQRTFARVRRAQTRAARDGAAEAAGRTNVSSIGQKKLAVR